MTRQELVSKLKPILFNTEMVQAILDDRKKQTRRLIKPTYKDDEYGFQICTNKATGERWIEKTDDEGGSFDIPRYVLPRYQVGDILYVRETWQCLNPYSDKEYVYKASCHEDFAKDIGKWRPSIHMPKEAARIFLKVTGVRVERLQDISENDALAEGVYLVKGGVDKGYYAFTENRKMGQVWSTAADCFTWGLWNNTVKPADIDKYGRYANPWLFAYDFERIN